MSLSPEERFKKIHEGGLAGIMYHYGGLKGIFKSKSLQVSVFFSSLIVLAMILIEKNNTELLVYLMMIYDVGISVDGGLIGLSLAGLTLVVTFGSGNFMKTLVRLSIEDTSETGEIQNSIYQTTTAKFAYAVFVQVLTLITLIGIKTIAGLELKISSNLAIVVNYIALWAAIILVFYSLLLVARMTINIFTVGQHSHLIYYKEVLDEDSKKSQEDEKK